MTRQPSHPHGEASGTPGAPPPLSRPVLPGRRPWWTAMWVSGLVAVLLIVVGVVLVLIAARGWESRVDPQDETLFMTGMLMAIAGVLFGCVAMPVCWVIDVVKRAT